MKYKISVLVLAVLLMLSGCGEVVGEIAGNVADAAAKELEVQIKETVLRLVTDAEMDYKEWVKAGAVKRAQVVEEIFMMYPILAKVTNQKELVAWIDDIIDEALETMREIFAENESQEAEASAD